VKFPTFNFRVAVGKKRKRVTNPEQLTEWMDGTPRFALSEDDIPIVVHLPAAFAPKSKVTVI